jgi:hypothetical protein
LLGALTFVASALLSAAAAAQTVSFPACTAHDGRPVGYRASVAIPDIALATMDSYSGEPLIYYNPYVIMWLPPQLRAWIHAHECAHHAMDHLRHGHVTAAQEIEADCWATRELTGRGILSPADIALMEQVIAWLLPAHWMHMPGRFRAIELQKCLSFPAPPWWRTPRANQTLLESENGGDAAAHRPW